MNKTYIAHHGIKGQKWGRRRFQNKDGSLTPEGVRRYGSVDNMERTRNRNKNIAIGVTATAAVAGLTYLAVKNRKQKKQIGVFQDSENARQKVKEVANAKRKATREFNKKHGIKNVSFKIKKHSDVKVTEYANSNRDKISDVKEFINVIGGNVLSKARGS